MKSTVIEKEGIDEQKFPCLKRSVNSGAIILFVSRNEGVAVYDPQDRYVLGHYSRGWTDCDLTNFFKPFHGQVILEND